MKGAIINFSSSEITIIRLSKEVEDPLKKDRKFNLAKYIYSLPGFDRKRMVFMTSSGNQSGLIGLRIGDQSNFPEFQKSLEDFDKENRIDN